MRSGVFGVFVAVLLLASALAHALLGWPAIRQALGDASVGADVLGGLAVGWYFGSAAMLAFAYVVLLQALRRLRNRATDAGSLEGIAAMYVLFGSLAILLRGLNSHFLLFVLTGVLVGVFAWTCRRVPAARAGEGEGVRSR